MSRAAIEIFFNAYGTCGPFGFCDRLRVMCKCLKRFCAEIGGGVGERESGRWVCEKNQVTVWEEHKWLVFG